jgi:hypothetical protein
MPQTEPNWCWENGRVAEHRSISSYTIVVSMTAIAAVFIIVKYRPQRFIQAPASKEAVTNK